MRHRKNNRKRHSKKINFNKLLKDMKSEGCTDQEKQTEEPLKTFEENIKPKEIIQEVPLETRIRSSKLDDKSNLYVYSKNKILHDRDCSYVKRISDKHFNMIQEYSDDFKKCKICNARMILRKAVTASNERYLNSLMSFMIKIKADEDDLLKLFIENNGILELITLNKEIQIHVKEDTWRIVLADDKTLTLMHNNYEALDNGVRIFKDTFHIQKQKLNFKRCVFLMLDYSYQQHCENEIRSKVNNMIDSHGDFYKSLKYILNMNEEKRGLILSGLSDVIKTYIDIIGED